MPHDLRELGVNTFLKKIVDPNDGFQTASDKNILRLHYTETVVLGVSFYDVNDALITDWDALDQFELSVDADYAHTLIDGVLDDPQTGAITSVGVTFPSDPGSQPDTGQITLRNSNNLYESVDYTAISGSGVNRTFTVSTTLTNSYDAGDVCSIADRLMGYVDETGVNVSGDWPGLPSDTGDKTTGKVSFRLDCGRYEFLRKVLDGTPGADGDLGVQIEIKRYPSGETKATVLMQDTIYARNTVRDLEEAEVSGPTSGDDRYQQVYANLPITGEALIASDYVDIYNASTGLQERSTVQRFIDLISGGAATWGSITGTLSDQTDLQNEFDAKQDLITALSEIGADIVDVDHFDVYDASAISQVKVLASRVKTYVYAMANAGLSALGNLAFAASTEKTISGGIIAADLILHRIDTEGDAGTDDLDTITHAAGTDIVFVRAENAIREVVLKDGTGNLELGGSDISLDNTDKYAILIWDTILSKWLIAGGSGSSAATVWGGITGTLSDQTDLNTALGLKADASALTTHTDATDNPHSTDIENLGDGTLAELNAAITDATLVDNAQPELSGISEVGEALTDADSVDGYNDSGAAQARFLMTRISTYVISKLTTYITGALGATDNALVRANGTGGTTAQGSAATLDDSGNLTTNSIITDTLSESTATNGVDVDSLNIKDQGVSNLKNQGHIASSELTISAGSVTMTQIVHRIDTEGDAGTDNLDTIVHTAGQDVIFIRAENAARDVVIRNGIGNIKTGGPDITLDDIDLTAAFVWDDINNNWVIIGDGSTAGASVAWGEITGTLSNQTDLQNELDAKLDQDSSSTEKTIATGVITADAQVHSIDTESDAATDDLVTITHTAGVDFIYVRAEHADRTVTLKDGTGNIYNGGFDMILDAIDKAVALLWDNTNSRWLVIGDGRATGASVAWGDISGTLSNQTDLQNELDAKQNLITALSEIGEDLVDGDHVDMYNASGTAQVKALVSRWWTYIESKLLAVTAKATPIAADTILINDSVGGDIKDVTFANFEATLDHVNIASIGSNTHAQIDTHVASSINPHSTDIGNLGTGTLAELNGKVTDATLVDNAQPELSGLSEIAEDLVDGDHLDGYNASGTSQAKILVSRMWTYVESKITAAGYLLGALGATDNVLLRSDGTGGVTGQGSNATLDDTGNLAVPAAGSVATDVISEVTGANGVTVDSLKIKDQGLVDLLNIDLPVSTEKTIATGVISADQIYHTVDTEGDIASDDLVTITHVAGTDKLFIRAEHTDRTVVVKHGTGNIQSGGADISLDATDQYLHLIYDAILTAWVVVGDGAGSGSGLGGSTGSTDNAVLRADGTGGSTVQSSGVIVDDNDNMTVNGIGTTAAALKTIATGVITADQMIMYVDTESAAATDDLVTITHTAGVDMIILFATSTSRVITLVDDTGNLILGDFTWGEDVVIPSQDVPVLLAWNTERSAWMLVSVGASLNSIRNLPTYVGATGGRLEYDAELSLFSPDDDVHYSLTMGDLRNALTFATSTTLTLALIHSGGSLFQNNAAATTITIPAEASVDFRDGTTICIVQYNVGVITIQADTGVTLNGVSAGGTTLTDQYTRVLLTKYLGNIWVIEGNFDTAVA